MYDETMPDTPIMGPTAGRGPEHLGCGCDRHSSCSRRGGICRWRQDGWASFTAKMDS